MGKHPWYKTQAKIAEYLLSSPYVSFRQIENFLGVHRPKLLRTIKYFEEIGLIETYREKRRKYVSVSNHDKLRLYLRRLYRKMERREEKKEPEPYRKFLRRLGLPEDSPSFVTEEQAEKVLEDFISLLMGLSTKPDFNMEAERYLGMHLCRDDVCMTFKAFKYVNAHERSRALFKEYVMELEKAANESKEGIEAAVLTSLKALRSRKTDPQRRRYAAAYLTTKPVWKTLLSIAVIGKQMKEMEERKAWRWTLNQDFRDRRRV